MRALKPALQQPSTVYLDISFQPMGANQTWWVARAWSEKGFVRWSSPCLDESHEHADLQAFEHRFGDCACTLPAFMRAMQWLDAECFGALSLDQVLLACLLNPEYGLACVISTACSNTLSDGETA